MIIGPAVVTVLPIVYTIILFMSVNRVNKLDGNNVNNFGRKLASPRTHIGIMFRRMGTITGTIEDLQRAVNIITVLAVNNQPI